MWEEGESRPSFLPLLLSLTPLFITPPPSLGVFTVSDLLAFPCLCEGSTVLSRASAAASVSSHLHPPPSIDPSLSLFISISLALPTASLRFSLHLSETQLSSFKRVHHHPLSLCFSLTSGVSRPPPNFTLLFEVQSLSSISPSHHLLKPDIKSIMFLSFF